MVARMLGVSVAKARGGDDDDAWSTGGCTSAGSASSTCDCLIAGASNELIFSSSLPLLAPLLCDVADARAAAALGVVVELAEVMTSVT
jgi:hypothetical protein